MEIPDNFVKNDKNNKKRERFSFFWHSDANATIIMISYSIPACEARNLSSRPITPSYFRNFHLN